MASIVDLMKPEILSSEPGACELRFAVRPEFTIPSGSLQGGIVTTMLDMAMAIAGQGTLSTASLHIEILRAVTVSEVEVSGRITKQGRRIACAEAEMRDVDGNLLARGTQTAVAN